MVALIILILLLTPLLYLPVAKDAFSAPKNLFVILICALLGILLAKRAAFKKIKLSVPAALFFGTFSLISAVSCLYSSNSLISLKYAGDILLYGVLALAAAHCAASDRKNITAFGNAVCAATIAVSVLGLLQVFHIDFFELTVNLLFSERSTAFLNFKERISSTMGNANFFGGYLVMSLPVAFALFIGTDGLKRGLFYGSASLLGLFCLVKTETANAWVAAALGLLIFVILAVIYAGERRKKLCVSLLAILVLGICAIAVLHPKEAILKIRNAGSFSTISERGRLVMWKAGLEMIKERPVTGFGAASYKIYVSKYEGRVLNSPGYTDYPYQMTKDAHNDYIQIWAELGVFGLLVFLLIIGSSLAFGYSFAKEKNTHERIIYFGLLAAVAGYAAHAFFNFPMKIAPIFTAFCVYCGILMSGSPAQAGMKNRLSGKIIVVIAVLVCGSLSAAAAFFFAANLETGYGILMYDRSRYNEALLHFDRSLTCSERFDYTRDLRTHFYKGNIYYVRGEYAEARGEFIKEIALNPYNADARYNMGLILDRLGLKEEAVESYKKALELEKTFSPAAEKLYEHGVK